MPARSRGCERSSFGDKRTANGTRAATRRGRELGAMSIKRAGNAGCRAVECSIGDQPAHPFARPAAGEDRTDNTECALATPTAAHACASRFLQVSGEMQKLDPV